VGIGEPLWLSGKVEKKKKLSGPGFAPHPLATSLEKRRYVGIGTARGMLLSSEFSCTHVHKCVRRHQKLCKIELRTNCAVIGAYRYLKRHLVLLH
jgi:hypothetical protein